MSDWTDRMPTHRQILPAQAIELVHAAGLEIACALLADFAAAGLIKLTRWYALQSRSVHRSKH